MENEKIKDEQAIAVWTEIELYDKIRECNNNPLLNGKEKENAKKQTIDIFIRKLCSKYTNMTEQEIRNIVEPVLNKTIKNLSGEER